MLIKVWAINAGCIDMNMQYQKGSALLFSLILLTVITLFATSTMKTSLLDEKMASNSQFTQQAYLEARSEIEAQYQYMVWSDHESISGEVSHIAGVQEGVPLVLESRLEDTIGTNTITYTHSPEKSHGALAGYSMGDSAKLGYFIVDVASEIAAVNSTSSQSLGLVRPLPRSN